jgi:hypothetical protein
MRHGLDVFNVLMCVKGVTMDPADLGLSDPFDSQENSSPFTNDELLSQLAGKEIDRLLSEVDEQLDAVIGKSRKANPSPALALRKYPEARHVSQQEAGLAQVLEGLEGSGEDREFEQRDREADERGEEIEYFGTPVEVFERVTGVEAMRGKVDLFPDFLEPTPVVLKPLEWVNAPFEGISQAALGAIGKVAIVCFVSAVALLAYVVVLTR